MLSRRAVMASAALAVSGSSASAQSGAPARPRSTIPAGACDTHVHVLDPARFPYSAKRRYTPGTATAGELARFLGTLGIGRVVVVQNSVYGTDNRVIIDAIRQLGFLRARGVVTLDQDTSPADLEDLDRNGIRGVRLNLEVGRERNAASAALQVEAMARRIPPTWVVQINASLPVVAGLKDTLMKLDRTVVLDHFAHAAVPPGVDQPGFHDVTDLLKAGKVVVKLSGPYQISKKPGYADIAPIAKAYLDAAPDRLIWGSDWPHTGGTNRPPDQPVEFIEPFRTEDDAFDLGLLADWVPDDATRRLILVETPARLFGFAS